MNIHYFKHADYSFDISESLIDDKILYNLRQASIDYFLIKIKCILNKGKGFSSQTTTLYKEQVSKSTFLPIWEDVRPHYSNGMTLENATFPNGINVAVTKTDTKKDRSGSTRRIYCNVDLSVTDGYSSAIYNKYILSLQNGQKRQMMDKIVEVFDSLMMAYRRTTNLLNKIDAIPLNSYVKEAEICLNNSYIGIKIDRDSKEEKVFFSTYEINAIPESNDKECIVFGIFYYLAQALIPKYSIQSMTIYSSGRLRFTIKEPQNTNNKNFAIW